MSYEINAKTMRSYLKSITRNIDVCLKTLIEKPE